MSKSVRVSKIKRGEHGTRRNTIYCTVRDDGSDELLMSATLQYLLSVTKERDYVIVNVQEILMWLAADGQLDLEKF